MPDFDKAFLDHMKSLGFEQREAYFLRTVADSYPDKKKLEARQLEEKESSKK